MLLMTNGLLVTGSYCSIKVWKFDDLQNAKCIKTLNNAHKNSVTSLLELPGNILASGSFWGYIKFWNFNNNDYYNFDMIGDGYI